MVRSGSNYSIWNQSGETFGQDPGHVAIASAPGRVCVAWDERGSGGSDIHLLCRTY